MDDVMTSNRKAKQAARARVAATGERYTAARRALRAGTSQPPESISDPPAIDPGEYAVRSLSWGPMSCQLVRYQGRHYVWRTFPGGGTEVYRMPGEAAGQAYLDDWHAFRLLTTSWDQQVARIFHPVPRYEAAVIHVEHDGIWLVRAGSKTTATRFDDLGVALEELARDAGLAAARFERDGDRETAQSLRDQAARVLETPPGVMPAVRPPGTRTADTPVLAHATHTVSGQQYTLVSYRDSADARCVAVDIDGTWGAPLPDMALNDRDLVNAGMSMATRGRGIAVIYGRAHDSVTGISTIMKNGERLDWPVHDDPGNAERYFTVIADCETLTDVVAVAPGRETSLRSHFDIWFSKAE
jgi:hypothetical protein